MTENRTEPHPGEGLPGCWQALCSGCWSLLQLMTTVCWDCLSDHSAPLWGLILAPPAHPPCQHLEAVIEIILQPSLMKLGPFIFLYKSPFSLHLILPGPLLWTPSNLSLVSWFWALLAAGSQVRPYWGFWEREGSPPSAGVRTWAADSHTFST